MTGSNFAAEVEFYISRSNRFSPKDEGVHLNYADR